MIDETKVNLVVAVSIVIDLGTLPSFFFLNPPGYVFCVLFHLLYIWLILGSGGNIRIR